VNHSGQKPHPQKGTGRARQGYLGAAQYKGGGRVGGTQLDVVELKILGGSQSSGRKKCHGHVADGRNG
jgi:hypothetical protein